MDRKLTITETIEQLNYWQEKYINLYQQLPCLDAVGQNTLDHYYRMSRFLADRLMLIYLLEINKNATQDQRLDASLGGLL